MPTMRKCPSCDFETEDEKIKFCPSDGTKLAEPVVWYDAFISYRHKGGKFAAQAIRASLQAHRGLNVFVDVNEVRPGPFDEALLGKIEAAPNFILVLSEDSLERCQNEGDWLRREIVHALKHGRHIIPVLIDGFEMPKAELLPADIRELTRWQAVRFDDTFPDGSYRRIGEWCKVARQTTEAARASVDPVQSNPAPSPVVPKPVGPDLGQAAAAAEWPRASSGPTRPTLGPTPGQNWTVPGLSIEMIWIKPGRFVMGSPETETGRGSDETQHRVTLTKGFWLGKYPVTQQQWQKLMGRNPSYFVTGRKVVQGTDIAKGFAAGGLIGIMVAKALAKGSEMPDSADCPVEHVSWGDCGTYIQQLNLRERSAERLPDGFAYVLPTEAQWEYACRAGSSGPFSGNGNPSEMGWHAANSGRRTHPVGQKMPNAWGLHDMHGNVREWCSDWKDDYCEGEVSDPTGPYSGLYRVTRGGSWGGGCALRVSAWLGAWVTSRRPRLPARSQFSPVSSSPWRAEQRGSA